MLCGCSLVPLTTPSTIRSLPEDGSSMMNESSDFECNHRRPMWLNPLGKIGYTLCRVAMVTPSNSGRAGHRGWHKFVTRSSEAKLLSTEPISRSSDARTPNMSGTGLHPPVCDQKTKRRAQHRRDHAVSETLRRPPNLQTLTPDDLTSWVGSDPTNRLTHHHWCCPDNDLSTPPTLFLADRVT